MSRSPKLALALSFGLALGIAGCGKPNRIKLYADPQAAYIPSPSSSNAFDIYVRCAEEAVRLCPEESKRVSFTPGQQKKLRDKLGPVLRKLAEAQNKPCQFQFVSHAPFTRPSWEEGWSLLSRVMLWGLEDSLRAQKYDAAVNTCIRATRFGFDLNGGGAVEAALGLSIADKARGMMLQHLNELNAQQCNHLAAGLKDALERKPLAKVVIRHEEQNMLMAIDAMHMAVQSKAALDEFDAKLVKAPDGVNRELERMLRMPDKQEKFFQSMADEVYDKTRLFEANSQQPAARRDKWAPSRMRPWGRLASLFLTTSDPIVPMTDKTLARTRMFLIASYARAGVLSSGAAPRDINFVSRALTTDPYTGERLRYRPEGEKFVVYSVGSDYKDDGGKSTDQAHSKPDLTLEN